MLEDHFETTFQLRNAHKHNSAHILLFWPSLLPDSRARLQSPVSLRASSYPISCRPLAGTTLRKYVVDLRYAQLPICNSRGHAKWTAGRKTCVLVLNKRLLTAPVTPEDLSEVMNHVCN
jgi:hypothetical protein